ncbi:DUF4238 domain-containing protein [Burkholderia ambifaria]|uniref:DUF4238 domain-containing protein n=1 Tax=Burkholderia ambifaria TaxID=152480 RepID=UPI001FC7E7A6|nr:DUF4238 domain-containing protein [Burkholderia ambifaria]
MAGKRQHYVPRFLQRGFLNDPHDEAQRTWLHRRSAKARLVGIRDVGVGEYFYSKLSTDGKATLDDLITEVEGDLDRELSILKGAPLVERVDPYVAVHLRFRFDRARDAAGISKIEFQFRDLRAKLALTKKVPVIYVERSRCSATVAYR